MVKEQTIHESEQEVRETYSAYIAEMKSLGFDYHAIDVGRGRFWFSRGGNGIKFGFMDPFPVGPVTRADCVNRVLDAAYRAGRIAEGERVICMLAKEHDIDLREM